MSIKVGIVDSGLTADLHSRADAQCRFVSDATGRATALPAETDKLGHGSAIARLILDRVPDARLLSAQVFTSGQQASASVIAHAIDWCTAEGACVINLSLGLHEDRRVLRESCLAAADKGVLLIASRAARGIPTYPAAYPIVLAASGDARCGENDYASIRDEGLFAASPHPPAGAPGGGSSYAAGRISGLAAAFFSRHPAADTAAFHRHLDYLARFHGRERRLTPE